MTCMCLSHRCCASKLNFSTTFCHHSENQIRSAPSPSNRSGLQTNMFYLLDTWYRQMVRLVSFKTKSWKTCSLKTKIVSCPAHGFSAVSPLIFQTEPSLFCAKTLTNFMFFLILTTRLLIWAACCCLKYPWSNIHVPRPSGKQPIDNVWNM